jgi:pimeloyl-ACP methyl ester carboxylesterase
MGTGGLDTNTPQALNKARFQTLDGMPSPDREGFILGLSQRGFHRIAYVEWGDPHSERVALCVHGLSRQGRDFDSLAAVLASQGWRVICPDLVGRGRSDWLPDPEEYTLPQYAMDMTALIARLGVKEVDWIGTSLGGLTGMVVAGQKDSPVRRLVINDIGPFLPWQALHHLSGAVREAPRGFASLDAATAHYRRVLAPFGHLSDDEWRHLARHGLTEAEDGTWKVLSDPMITAAFRPGWLFNLTLWNYWDAITCPVLALRGVESDLLLPQTVEEMTSRGPKTTIVEILGCGHAPALMDDQQIDAITDWLHATELVRD